MSDKGTFMVATLVDWNNGNQFNKTWKKISKVWKKQLNGKNSKRNRLNTFVVAEVDLKKVPSKDNRVQTEEELRKILQEYSNSIFKAHYNNVSQQTTISKIYADGFKALNRADLIEKYNKEKAQRFIKIETEIEKVGADGGVMIWDLPGFEGDRIVLPELEATLQDYPNGYEELVNIVDELLIANFSRRFLPFSYQLINEATNQFRQFEELSQLFTDNSRIPKELIKPLQTFIGVISGIQEVLKLFKREVSKVYKIATETFEFLHRLPSTDMKEWATINDPELGNKILTSIDTIMQIIVNHKPDLRNLLTGTEEVNQYISNRLMVTMIDIDVISGGLLSWTHRFQQLPSFSTLDEGIAYEELEGEKYSPKSNSAALEAQTLFKTFNRGDSYIYALRGVEVTIDAGEFVVIRGPSGAGKTTLLNLLAGLDVPQRGGVFFENQDLIHMKDKKRSKLRRENFSFIFQSYALIPHLNSYENAKLPLDLGGFSNELKSGIQKLLDDVGIGEYATHKPAMLSGGQMQRLGIARALANRPKVLFADEPTGDLDEKTGMAVIELLKKYHEETGMTIVLVTHDEKVAKFATREIFLMDGRVVDKLEDA